ncbi:hypothetical protein CPHO_03730 [Corynebacterium phocae]|uniref:Uncharacterized protein n=1 Tax=Corynebacterium phocae TaxID=161895 RepID=A0A1L7D243_9CORY|nr:hypothetical protein [Corynebacterium phocae]APT92143.1 hypothetical protein CPHO_03730 [Corynebacterium phocae]KAA8725927.1 hypothetical protein F4V58_03275 [Corynebacterium phocae]
MSTAFGNELLEQYFEDLSPLLTDEERQKIKDSVAKNKLDAKPTLRELLRVHWRILSDKDENLDFKTQVERLKKIEAFSDGLVKTIRFARL